MAQEVAMGNLAMDPIPPPGISLYTEKLITLFSMAVVTFLFGMLPLKIFSQLRNNTDITSRIRWRHFISFCSCFAGGVFIGACLLDLLPDVEESFQKVFKEIQEEYKIDLDYPVAQFVLVFGFFLILLIEQTVLHFQEKWEAETERSALLSQSENISYQSINDTDNDDSHQHDHTVQAVSKHSSLRSVLLLIALSFHSVFEGLAIGLQENARSLLSLFIAVTVHKAIMSFSLGLNLAQSNLSIKSFVISNILFSISSPIGIGIGIAVSDLPNNLPQDVCKSLLQGIAGGTFLYITFFEVLPNELNEASNHRLWKVLFVILGYSAICGILFITH